MTATPADTARRLLPALRAARSQSDVWPASEWRLLVDAGVTGWIIPAEFGGSDHPTCAVLDGCRGLARANLSATFILSQFQAACQRIVACENAALKSCWLPRLANGNAFATVGISHLTTSRQHIAAPAVTAVAADGGYILDGVVPWVTGADVADVIVLGGALSDGRQVLAAVPRDRSGVTIDAPAELLSLNNSRTALVRLTHVMVRTDELLAGPVPQVLSTLSGKSGGTGSLTTSALAVGHAGHAIDRIAEEAVSRLALNAIVAALTSESEAIVTDLQAAALGQAAADITAESLRTRATSLALRASQAYLAAAKGAGYVVGHPAERLVREAMFFLVWSCPQAVASQLLNEFSRCEET
ncbi:MAG TPA: acyl-CoA dehydrogenase family protein [Planctomycetaceae bacterium]|nr:acyl-CoA dehydrogenase family protein [Planctomycetaceae bacterium]